jgi:hypothetical protein
MNKTHHFVLVRAQSPEALTQRLNEAHAGGGQGARLVAADLEGCTALVEYRAIMSNKFANVPATAERWPDGIDNSND